jgi:hypothetical protein
MNVSGTLRSSEGIPLYNGNVNMKVANKNFSANAVTDAEGHFVFSNITFYDSSQVILSARNNPASINLSLSVESPALEPVAKNYYDPFEIANIDSTLRAYLQNSEKQSSNNHILKEVVIKSTKTDKVTHENYTALSGLISQPDQTIGPEILKYCSSDFNGCVMTKIFGLYHVDDDFYIKSDYVHGNKLPIQFFVNGAAVQAASLQSTLNPADIESMEIYLKDNVSKTMQFYNCNGIISITTKNRTFSPDAGRNNLSLLHIRGDEITVSPKGFYKSKVFYSPKYALGPKPINDRRSTIYWNPVVLTDKNGNATFDFFNASGTGTYKAVIEGIDTDGNIGRYVLRYQVN